MTCLPCHLVRGLARWLRQLPDDCTTKLILAAQRRRAGGADFAGFYRRANGQLDRARLVQDVYRLGTCYSLDWGHVLTPEKTGGCWALVYGAVSNRSGVSSCMKKGYSEDIWLAFSPDGRRFPGLRQSRLLLSSLALKDYAGEGAMHDDIHSPCAGEVNCSGYNIGEPTVARHRGQWYMLFDSQSCHDAQHNRQFGLVLAEAAELVGPWHIVAKLDGSVLPGVPPFQFPRFFSDPLSGCLLFFYQDAHVHIHAAELADGRVRLLPEGRSVLRENQANMLSLFYSNERAAYFALADEFGDGSYQNGLKHLFLLGPSGTPLEFDWAQRRKILAVGDWFAGHLRAPQVIVRRNAAGREVIDVYFWGKLRGGHELGRCAWARSVKMGLLADIDLA